jgi:tetratricopeptide (TPR) repeat protein
LLAYEERRLYARLAVFAGGCTLEAGEAVAGADVDILQSLVEKSLLSYTDRRFWMLETIREYALERLAESGESDTLWRQHGLWFLELARRQDSEHRAGDPEEGPVAVLEQEIDNLRAAVDFGLESGDSELVREITATLPMYWIVRGRYVEARSWLERALALDDAVDDTRRRLLSALGTIAYLQGDYETAIRASDEAAALAERLGGATDRLELLGEQAVAALRRGDFRTAETLFRDRFALAAAVDNGVATSACRLNLAYIANKEKRPDDAEALLAENLPFVRSRGQARCEAYTLASIAETAIRCDAAHKAFGDAALATTRAVQIDDQPLAVYSLELFAVAAAAHGERRLAAAVLGATEAARQAMGSPPDEDEEAIRAYALELIDRGDEIIESAWNYGRALDLASAVKLAETAFQGDDDVQRAAGEVIRAPEPR